MTTTRSRVRRARKTHRCGCANGPIHPGQFYIEHTQLPGADADYANAAGHPVRMAECRDCAERYGRGHLIAAAEADR